MSIRIKIIFLLVFFLTGLSVFFILHFNHTDSHLELYVLEKTKEKEKLFDTVVKLKSEMIKNFVYDYTRWDEMVSFSKNPNLKWAVENIAPAMKTFHVQLAWVLNQEKKLIYSHSHIKGFQFNLPQEFIEQLEMQKEFVSFYFSVDGKIFEIQGASIHNTDDLERKRNHFGFFFTAFVLDEEYIGELLNLVDKNAEIKINSKAKVQENSFKRILTNWNGNESANLQVFLKKNELEEKYEEARKTELFYFYYFLAYIFITLGILFIWIFYPLKKIYKAMKQKDLKPILSLINKKNEMGEIAQLIEVFFTQSEEIEHTQSILLTIAENMDELIYLRDVSSYKILYANKKALEKIWGYSVEDFYHDSYISRKTIKKEYADWVNTKYDLLVKEKKPFQIEYEILRKDGEKRWIRNKAFLIEGENNKDYIVGLVEDITEKKVIDERLEDYHKKIELELMKKEENLIKARDIQRNLISKELPVYSDLNISAVYMPSEEVGGDFFYVSTLFDKMPILLGDCEGHGIEAAMDSVLAKSICDRYLNVLEIERTDIFSETVNNDIIDYFKNEKFLTLFSLVMDLSTKLVTYSNAGCEVPFVIRKKEVISLEMPANFSYIGFEKEMSYRKDTFQLQEGDVFFIFSDALRELILDDGKMLGREKIELLLKSLSGNLSSQVKMLMKEIEKLNQGFPLEDDLTLIFIQYKKSYEQKFSVNGVSDVHEIEVLLEEKMTEYDYGEEETESFILSCQNLMEKNIELNNSDNFSKFQVLIKIGFNEAAFIIKYLKDKQDNELKIDIKRNERKTIFLN